MIVFAELQMQGNKHVGINRGLLSIIAKSFPGEEIKIICDTSHYQELGNKEAFEFTHKTELFNYTGDIELRKVYLFRKLYREILLVFRIFKNSKNDTKDTLIFASIFPFTGFFLDLIARVFKKNIIVCMHGDLGVLTLRTKKIKIKILRYFVKLFLIIQNKYVRILLYGESIFQELIKLNKNYEKRSYIIIDHPYVYNDINDTKTLSNPVSISGIGTGLINKNSHFVYELGKFCKAEINNGSLIISQIGNVSNEVNKYSNEYVRTLFHEGFIDTLKFEKALRDANYFIYFFSANSYYDLCPSGTFFDAIKYGTPIISLHNPFFDYYFSKFGDIGYLCNDVEEMAKVINIIVNEHDQGKYSRQVENIYKAQFELSYDKIALSFLSQVRNVKF